MISLFLIYGSSAVASSVKVSCRGGGASQDRFVYNAIFSSSISDESLVFNLHADGRGPGGQYDINNRFKNIRLNTQMKKDHRGRPLSIEINGTILPDNREIDLILDLSRPKSMAELELMREDNSFIFANLSCETKLPQKCRNAPRCWRHCHPMIGCERRCEDRRACEPGKYAYEND